MQFLGKLRMNLNAAAKYWMVSTGLASGLGAQENDSTKF